MADVSLTAFPVNNFAQEVSPTHILNIKSNPIQRLKMADRK